MCGVATVEPTDVTLVTQAVRVRVYRFRPEGNPRFEHLPNVQVLTIQSRQGADPGLARFRYVFDGVDPTTDPTSLEQALSVDCNLLNVVKNDERLVVWKEEDGDAPVPIFDGFAQVPELNLSPLHEIVTFVAYGVAVRLWDRPIAGALMRDATDPKIIHDVETELETQFNPGDRPNATPEGADATTINGARYPTLLDPAVVRDPDVRRPWSLSMAARYLCFRHNADETYVKNPDSQFLETLLDGRVPVDGHFIDPADASSFKSRPIRIPDTPISGRPWPLVLHELLEPNGFGLVFHLESGADGIPVTRLKIFRKQEASSSIQKDLFLQKRGEALDPLRTNVSTARLARDTTSLANSFRVRAAPVRFEATFILSPGFEIRESDAATNLTLRMFHRGSQGFLRENNHRYRLYVFDETGEGHWSFAQNTLVKTPPDLGPLFANDATTTSDYVKRRRIPFGELLTRDANQQPLRPRLSVSNDYQGSAPGLWDGTGTWQEIVGGYDLLRDRLGIWVNVPNPNGWNIGLPANSTAPFPSGILRGVEEQALAQGRRFVLRLTCVVEGDSILEGTVGRRPSSFSEFTIERHIRAETRYAKAIVAGLSEFNPNPAPLIVRDDTDLAVAEAISKRAACEAGEVAGTVVIPRFTMAYEIGDRIRSIRGRDVFLRTNAGAPVEEGMTFPTVVGRTWQFEGRQETTLHLSDYRGIR